MRRLLILTVLILSSLNWAHSQTCTSNPATIPTTRNFSAISWTSSGGASCPPAANFTGNIVIDLPNGVTITMNSSITISGNFTITNSGSSTLYIPSGVTVHVNGNMGDPSNNNVTYNVNGTLIVDGTLSGNNGNVFQGTGSISGGTLDVKNGATCPAPCPVTGNWDNCNSGSTGGGNFCTEVALPVKLLYFNAAPSLETVALNWATSMEEDFARFVIQRSSDGLAFHDIGEVPGRGFNIHDIVSKYDFEDEAPLLGFNYYRLKAIDLDDTFEYFGVKAIKMQGGKKLAIYPNPSAGEIISFRTNFNPSESDRIIISNQLGVEVFNVPASSVQNLISLPFKLHGGIYMLRYVSKDFEQASRVVVKN